MAATLVQSAVASRTFSLDQVRVASPCPKHWGDMSPVEGSGDRVRRCGDCELNVYNLSNMTREEAEALLAAHDGKGRLCAGFYRRADGTILTRDCPVGLRALRLRAVAAWARVGAAAAILVTSTLAMGAKRGWWSPRLTDLRPFAAIRQMVQPGWQPRGPQVFIAGDIGFAPPPTTTPQGN